MSLPTYAEAQMPIRLFFELRYGVHARVEYNRARSRPKAGTWATLYDVTGVDPDVAARPIVKRSVGGPNPYQPWIDYQVNVLKRRGSDDEFRAWINGRVAKMNASNALVKAGAMTPFSLREPVKPLSVIEGGRHALGA
jgi:hypothetical protein